jgi:hypothetical protein
MESNKPFDIELFIHSQQQKTIVRATQWACHEQNIYVKHIKKWHISLFIFTTFQVKCKMGSLDFSFLTCKSHDEVDIFPFAKFQQRVIQKVKF